ncbi:MAG TPA: insulinase family protein [Alphaproteobacteria bacterium]|nr:insulinase family protein [Alphaproteobacteria bacterium]
MIRRYFRRMVLILTALMAGVLLTQAQSSAPAKPQAPAKPTASARASAGKAEKKDAAEADLAAIKRPPLPAFHPGQPRRVQLSNGMVIFLLEDHQLPLIEGSAIVAGGSVSEPADKVGLVSIFAGSWRTGGTKTRTGDQLDDLLAARAVQLETGGDQDFTAVNLSCLKADFDYVLDIFNDLLRNPEFRQDKIDLAKDGIRTNIARRNDSPATIASRESSKIGYGLQSPYARVPEYSTIAAVTRQDLLDWHARHVAPNNIILGVTGDFDSAAMEAKLRQAFESWPKGPDVARPKIDINPPRPGVYFIARDDVNQSEIRMVAPGIRKDDPDFYAAEVMNQLFGGSFGSRLFTSLRTKAGLAYAVGGGVLSTLSHPGLTRLSMGTKSSTTAKAIEGLYQEIDGMHTRPVTPGELEKAKSGLLNSFVFEFDSKKKIMSARISYELYGYPPDFLERYQKGVEAVTTADIDRVARKYLDKSKFAVLVVGKAADFDKPLSTFGPVANVDITIPQPGAPASAALAVSNPEGKALLAKVLEAAGGADRLKSIRSVRRKSTLTLKAQGVSLDTEETVVTGEKAYMKMNTPGGEMIMVVGSQGSFMSMGAMGTRDMPSSQREDRIKGLRREMWAIAQHAADPQYAFTAQGKEKIGDVEATILDVSIAGDTARWLVDAKTGHVLRAQFQANGPTGPATQVVDFSDWKTVDGVTLPFHAEVSVDGQPSISAVLHSIEFNPEVDPKLFDKPGPQ